MTFMEQNEGVRNGETLRKGSQTPKGPRLRGREKQHRRQSVNRPWARFAETEAKSMEGRTRVLCGVLGPPQMPPPVLCGTEEDSPVPEPQPPRPEPPVELGQDQARWLLAAVCWVLAGLSREPQHTGLRSGGLFSPERKEQGL